MSEHRQIRQRISRGTSQAERWMGVVAGWFLAFFVGFMIYHADAGNAWRAILDFALTCLIIAALVLGPAPYDGNESDEIGDDAP